MVKIKGTKGRRLPNVEMFASVEADVPDLDGVAGGLARIYAEIDSAIARELAKTADAPSVATILEEARRREVPPALLRRVCVKEFGRGQVKELGEFERARLYRLLQGMNGEAR